MTAKDEEQKFCIEFADFPGADMPWLIEKAAAIEGAMAERLSGMFLWHSVVAHPEIDGFRVFFQVAANGEGANESIATTLVEIIREIAGSELPGSEGIAA